MTWMIKIQMNIVIHINSYLDLTLSTQCSYNLYKNVEYSCMSLLVNRFLGTEHSETSYFLHIIKSM